MENKVNFTQNELEAIAAAWVTMFEAADRLEEYGRQTGILGIVLQGQYQKTALKCIAYEATRELERKTPAFQSLVEFKDKIFPLWQK
jgi:hypothetical protein